MIRVVDASVALRWYVEAPGSEAAAELLAGDDPLIAPDLIVAEVASAAWKLAAAGEIDAEHGSRIAVAVASAFSHLAPASRLIVRAWRIAAALGHPVYDGLYVSLAELESARLVTADRRLLDKLAGTRWRKLVEPLPGSPG